MNADEVIQIRRMQGLSQEQMAEKAGVSRNIIIDAENSKLRQRAFPATLKKLADAYGLTIEQIEEACAVKDPVGT
jgi:transcriptional regulator with XRE-family HTH domain